MILLCGIPSEPPLAMVRDALVRLGVPQVTFDQRRFAEAELEFSVPDGGGRLLVAGRSYRLEDVRGVYLRLMDHRQLPEIRDEREDADPVRACDDLHAALVTWSEVMPGRVVNRAAAMASNMSKPYQAQLILAAGLAVPDTLVTNDPERVIEFRRLHGRVVYKSISGVRSIVQELNDADLARLDRIRWCPVQFQEYVAGTDVRVHVVGEAVHATEVCSEATDYRYAADQVGRPAELAAVRLPDDVAERCVALTRTLGLAFAGIDLRMARDGRVVCFEANPSPAFSYYEGHTGQPIADSVANYLAGMAA